MEYSIVFTEKTVWLAGATVIETMDLAGTAIIEMVDLAGAAVEEAAVCDGTTVEEALHLVGAATATESCDELIEDVCQSVSDASAAILDLPRFFFWDLHPS